MNWTVVAAVAAGGAVGSAGRYLVSVLVQRLLGTGFPWWTLTVNVAGSLIMGILVSVIALRWSVGQTGQAFLMVGVLGGFTTFSAFSLDVATLVERNASGPAAAYVIASVVLSIGALFAGMTITRALLS
jgi:CrcB protein